MTIAPPNLQLNLLQTAPSWTITKNAQARNAYGTMAQEIVCAALGLTPVPINGNYECCFDAERSGVYFEIKSVKRRGGKVVIYDWRMEKEANAGVPLLYAILCHNVKGSDGRHLLSEFIAGGLTLLVVPASLVHAFAHEEPLRTLVKAQPLCTGYNRGGYVKGYRNVPVTKLVETASVAVPIQVTYAGREFDVKLRTIRGPHQLHFARFESTQHRGLH